MAINIQRQAATYIKRVRVTGFRATDTSPGNRRVVVRPDIRGAVTQVDEVRADRSRPRDS